MKNNKQKFIPWLIMAAMGIFLIIGHGLALDIMGKVLAVGLIVTAAAGVITFFRTKEKKSQDIAKLIGFAVLCILGIWILLNTPTFITVINVVLGAIMILSGVLNLYHGWKMGKDIPTIVLSLVGIVLGFIIAFNNAATTWMTVMEGIGLIYSAVTGFISERKAA